MNSNKVETGTKKVLIIYKFLPEYRVDFYQHLKRKLLENNVELNLIYGKFNKVDALRKIEVDIDWANYVASSRINIGSTELLWQPCLSYLSDKDLIITQQESRLLLNYYLIVSRYFSRYKYAFWGHVTNMQDDPTSLRNKFKSFFLNKCDWWFAYTKGAKQYLVDNKFPENKITAVQNAIDTSGLKKYYSEITDIELSDLKKQLNIEGNNVGIYCGSMYPEKDFDFIIEACCRVKKEVPDFHMLFLGSGSEASKIEKAAETNNWIHYIGPKFGRERVIYFKISSIQIMPKLVGLCILDSFAMETPIITTDHPFHGPEIDYLENGKNGIMTINDIQEYSNAVIGILKDKTYIKLIDEGKLSAEIYTVENMAENFKNGILACLKN